MTRISSVTELDLLLNIPWRSSDIYVTDEITKISDVYKIDDIEKNNQEKTLFFEGGNLLGEQVDEWAFSFGAGKNSGSWELYMAIISFVNQPPVSLEKQLNKICEELINQWGKPKYDSSSSAYWEFSTQSKEHNTYGCRTLPSDKNGFIMRNEEVCSEFSDYS